MKIAVICAPQTFGCNYGMTSVDLAAWCFFKKYYPDAQLSFYTLYPHCCDLTVLPYIYQGPEDFLDTIQGFDFILYWGDFLHGYSYKKAVTNILMNSYNFSIERADSLVKRFLYLQDQPQSVLDKSIIYGSTILFNSVSSYEDRDYQYLLEGFFKRLKSIWMREAYSAQMVRQIRKDAKISYRANDCALLLDKDLYATLTEEDYSSNGKNLGVFFGRSYLAEELMIRFLLDLEAKLEVSLEWLDWGNKNFFIDCKENYKSLIPSLKCSESISDPISALKKLDTFSFIVSDTYHVCVNAWNLGIPAICVIDNLNERLEVNEGKMGGRDKRIIFYWQMNLQDFLFYASDFSNEQLLKEKLVVVESYYNNSLRLNQLRADLQIDKQLCQSLLCDSLK